MKAFNRESRRKYFSRLVNQDVNGKDRSKSRRRKKAKK